MGLVFAWLVSSALAADCTWAPGGRVSASMTEVRVGGVSYEVKGRGARQAFHDTMAACGASSLAHDAFDSWRARRRTINWASIYNLLYGLPVHLAQPAQKRDLMVRELQDLQASRVRGGEPAAPASPEPLPAEVPPTPSLASRWPSVEDPLRVTADAGADAAVIIGLEDYAFIADVPYARRDARAFYNLAVYTLGIPSERVHQLDAGSVEQIRAQLAEAGKQVGPGGRVWVYYAGHGAASPVTRERLLLGDDVRADPAAFDARSLPVSEVERLASSGGGQPMVVLDTCFAGHGRGGDSLVAGTRFAVPAYAASSEEGVQWAAAAPNELSGPLDGAEHGAFTYFVVGALRGWADGELTGQRDGVVTGDEAQAYVRRALGSAQKRGQTPSWVGLAAGEVELSRGTEEGPEL